MFLFKTTMSIFHLHRKTPSSLLLLSFFSSCIISTASPLDFQSPDQLLQHEDFLATSAAHSSLDGIVGNIWARERSPRVKPRRKDLFEPKLMALLGKDFDMKWMKKKRDREEIRTGYDEFIDRKTIRTLRALVNSSSEIGISPDDDVRLPDALPPEYRELVKNWLIQRVTCPVKFSWHDLGDLWYPRWVSKGSCVGHKSDGRGRSCSWPPGMTCMPSGTKVLYLLRWHCRKRKPKKRKKVNDITDMSAEQLLSPETLLSNGHKDGENRSSAENHLSPESFTRNQTEIQSQLSPISSEKTRLSDVNQSEFPDENRFNPLSSEISEFRASETTRFGNNRLSISGESRFSPSDNRFSPISSKMSEEKAKVKRFRQRHKCSWLKVPFPVPADCSCSCKH